APASRGVTVLVQMLDDSLVPFNIQLKWPAKVLFDMVCKHLGLLESDYFGLEYCDSEGVKVWLDMERSMSRQPDLSSRDLVLWLCVKFYTPDPAKLEDELTRYLFSLQIRRDLAQGQLRCNSKTTAVLASYIIQSEHGDYEPAERPGWYRVLPGQDAELERRIVESHRRLAGQPPSEAELNLLETARRCELYGMKMHPAKDHEGVPLNLTVAHMGIVVFQHLCRINTFSWGKIRKISFKRRRFLVKLHPDGARYYKDTVEFFFESRNHCKNFWKKCVEHHGFFRCLEARQGGRSRPSVIPKGSSFRFTGRTQKQVAEFARESFSKQHVFNRSQSFRTTSSSVRSSSLRNVGTSLSANPLIPIDMENDQCERTPVSLSFGSVTLTSSMTPRSPPSLTDHDTGELDTTSRGEATTSAASSLPAARPGHLSPDSELSSAPTDSFGPAARRPASRLSRSSPSLSETPEESERAGAGRRLPCRRQLSRDSSSLSSVVEINTVIDRRQLLDDTVSHDSYDLLEPGLRPADWGLPGASEHGEYQLAAETGQEEWLQVRSVPGTLERVVLQRLWRVLMMHLYGPSDSTRVLFTSPSK
ncbi:FERM, ARHGEF and pleckstrin domain-containing protein 1-like, partial [Pollicipes pollicipes]|uniref:FERM, ARHGEF and pleckstrin domain-containing protein 1-like n=1 Tax=Pollicipes pollicipes TaxID=41117 RepID=UPI00188553A9